MMFKYLKMVEVFAKKVDFFFRSSLEERRFVPGVINVLFLLKAFHKLVAGRTWISRSVMLPTGKQIYISDSSRKQDIDDRKKIFVFYYI